MTKRWQDQAEPEPTPAVITDAWHAWSRGEITFAEYLTLALAATADAEEITADE